MCGAVMGWVVDDMKEISGGYPQVGKMWPACKDLSFATHRQKPFKSF